MRHLVYISATLALVGCAEAPADSPAEEVVPEKAAPTLGGKADGFDGGGLPYSATSTVEALDGDLGSMDPAVGGRAGLYLRPMSALGYYGPVGPYGPLGLLGPVGDGVWSPSRYVSGDLGWHVWSDLLDAADGPLGPDGPLGRKGPLNPDEWVTLGGAEDAPVYDDGFRTHLGPGGVFAVLGPAGPLGALGPLGPLGPVGAHGLETDADGRFVDTAGDVQRTVDVEWEAGGEVRTYGLFEHYPEDTAERMDDNDTSFMVSGEIRRAGGEADAFTFHSTEAQWLTVTVVPHYARLTYAQAMSVLFQAALVGYTTPAGLGAYPWIYNHRATFDDFDLELEVVGPDGSDLGTARSVSGDRVDWLHLRVPAGAKLQARVTLYYAWKAVWRSVAPQYRLLVVGSTKHLKTAPITGDHVRSAERE